MYWLKLQPWKAQLPWAWTEVTPWIIYCWQMLHFWLFHLLFSFSLNCADVLHPFCVGLGFFLSPCDGPCGRISGVKVRADLVLALTEVIFSNGIPLHVCVWHCSAREYTEFARHVMAHGCVVCSLSTISLGGRASQDEKWLLRMRPDWLWPWPHSLVFVKRKDWDDF